MKNENENGVPEGLKELSSLAVKKQVIINENYERLHLCAQHFLRAFNSGLNDPDMIRERAEALIDQCDVLRLLLLSITKPYID